MTAALFRLRLLIDRLSMRERVLVLLTLVMVLSLLSYAFLWYSGWNDQSPTRTRIEQLQTQTTDNREALLAIERTRNSPQLQALDNQNERLRRDIQELNDRISGITDVLIPPDTMATLLRELLGNSDLTLVRFTALPALPVAENDSTDPSLYRHRLDIELTGSFDALTRYLDTIETLPWRLFWDELSVETTRYPTLRIRLKVHTLSDQEDWLNV
jgi:MSHA biogenesis protein MshJ